MESLQEQFADIAGPGLDAWLHADGMLLLVLLVVLTGIRLAGLRHFMLRLLVVFLALRLVLLGNPWVWQLYTQKLEFADIGWRQYSVISKVRDSYLQDIPRPRYLAVGSSQTGIIYADYASKHDDFGIFEIAGMTPLDFMMFREQIADYRPETLLLYLSDFDIARRIPPESISMAPRQGLGLPGVWTSLGTLSGDDVYTRARVEMLAGEIFPEFKYGFIFRGISKKAMRLVAQRLGRQEPPPPQTRTPNSVRIKLLRETIETGYIDANMAFLRDFMEFTATASIPVVIVEGQYHPGVFNETILRANREVAGRLSALADEFGHVRYIPRSMTGEFAAEDYTDLTHVRPHAGYDFARHLVALLEPETPGEVTALRQEAHAGRESGF